MTALREEAFIDASKIESLSGLTYGVNRPAKSASNPVFTGTDGAFDHHVVYVSAVPDPDGTGVRLYPGTHTENWGRGRLALCESTDGLTFTKPNVGLHTVDGDTDNNCVIDSTFKTFPFVTHVPSLEATPYVAVGLSIPVDGSSERYVKVWVSADGINFGSPVNSITITGQVRDSMSIVRRADDRWLIFCQTRTGGDVRCVGVWLSDTTNIASTTWTFVNEFLLTGTSTTYQYYSFGAWRDGEVTYAVMSIYDGTGYYQNETYPSPSTPVPFITTNTQDRQFKFELWATRNPDGLTGWTRIDANWVWSGANTGTLDSSPGEWDYGCMVIGAQPVRVGDDWRYYYGGAREQHHPSPAGPYGTLPWTQRQAGFMSVPYRRIGKISGTGHVVLDPVTASASSALTINSAGTVEVELLHATTGAVLAGYARADCDAIPADTFGHTVTWNGSSFTPDNYKAKVYLTAATVYYVEITESAGGRLVVDAGDDDWAQIGTSITVNATAGVASSTLATIYSVNGGTIRFSGPDASKFAVSADGVSWAATLVVAAGAGDVHLRVTPDPGDVALSALIGIPA